MERASPGSRLDADHPENGGLIPCLFTVSCLRSRAARYRQLMANTDHPRHVKRYRERSQLLDEPGAAIVRQPRSTPPRAILGRGLAKFPSPF